MESPSNKELCGVTPEDSMFLVPNNEVNQLCQHTRAYLKSIGQIPRAWSSQKRTRPYGENKTLAATIDDLILDTISEIRALIETIEHQGETRFPNFLDFPEEDSHFQDFPEVEEGGSSPPSLLKTTLLVLLQHLLDQISDL